MQGMGGNWFGGNWFGGNWVSNSGTGSPPVFASRPDRPLAQKPVPMNTNAKFLKRDWDPDLTAIAILPEFLAVRNAAGQDWSEAVVVAPPETVTQEAVDELQVLAVTERPEALGEILQEHQNLQICWLQLLNINGASHPATFFLKYKPRFDTRRFVIDAGFGAVPVGSSTDVADFDPDRLGPRQFNLEVSDYFLVRGYLNRDASGGVPDTIDGEMPVFADPMIGAHETGLYDRAKGTSCCVRKKIEARKLAAHGLDGDGVAIAIVDTGIYLPHLKKLLEATSERLDRENSWDPQTLVTKAGMHRIGHGTMCAYDALIAAPKATLLDIPMLTARPIGDHTVPETISAAMQGYGRLIERWILGPGGGQPRFKALVVNNSWGIFHPSLDLSRSHPGRFTDNPHHIFRLFVRVLNYLGADIVFAASNCGTNCTSAVCLGRSEGMIMGANAYPEVLTVAGCDVEDRRVCYSSKGPGIADINVTSEKPNLTAYTHFLGSKVYGSYRPDSGTSAACAVTAGCVAALRTRAPKASVSPAQMIQTLQETAHQVGPPGWNPDYGHGIIRPVKAAEKLGLSPS